MLLLQFVLVGLIQPAAWWRGLAGHAAAATCACWLDLAHVRCSGDDQRVMLLLTFVLVGLIWL